MWAIGDSYGLGLSDSSCGPVEILVDWVYRTPHVGQWRFLWIEFICLEWTSGGFSGLRLSASSGPAEAPVDCVYLPQGGSAE